MARQIDHLPSVTGTRHDHKSEKLLTFTMATLPLLALLSGGPAIGPTPAPGYRSPAPYQAVEAAKYRFFQVSSETSKLPEVYYFPAEYSLVEWPVVAGPPPSAGTLVLRESTAKWAAAASFPIRSERHAKESRVRFAVPRGHWSAALILPGFEPEIGSVDSSRGDSSLSTTRLRPAVRLRGRFVDSRTNVTLTQWKATLAPPSGSVKTEEEALLSELPISEGGSALDFGSIPVGSWKLQVAFPGRGTRVQPLHAMAGEEVIDLGTVAISDAGELEVSVDFPEGRPTGQLSLAVYAPSDADRRQPKILSSSLFDCDRAHISGLTPGAATIAIVGNQRQELHRSAVEVKAGQTTNLALMLVPIVVSGIVSRNQMPLPETKVQLRNGPQEFSGISDSNGIYRITAWSPGKFLLLAFPPGSRIPIPLSVEIPDGTRELNRDIELPGGLIFGTVADVTTKSGIPGADVEYSAVKPKEGEPAVSASVQTNETGEFRIENLITADVSLTVSAKGYADKTIERVAPSLDGTSVFIELRRESRLAGIVVDEFGNPLGGATLGIGVSFDKRFFMGETTSDQRGAFHFDEMSSGSFDLFGFRCGYKLATQQVSVGEASERVRLILPKATPLTVHVEDERGSPVPRLPLSFRIGNAVLPLEYPSRYLASCGSAAMTDGDGDLSGDFLPLGPLTALDTSGLVLGTFMNSGSGLRWVVRVRRNESLTGDDRL